MHILLSGSGGMLARDVSIAAQARGHTISGVTRSELDITDAADVARVVQALAPDAIINAAAWTDVDGAQSEPAGAFAVNEAGAAHIAQAAAAAGAFVVHVSTDYVFAGDESERPYVESDPTGPRTVYGASKLAGEQALAASGAEHAIARTAWLFGLGGRNFLATMLSLAHSGRDEIAVVDDQFGCPTFTGHLAVALVELAERRTSGIVHLAAAGHCSWNEFAAAIFADAGVACRVTPASSADMARPAPRPAWSVLGTERTDIPRLADWREGLRAHLAERAAVASGMMVS